ncbi:hypothetical protein Patl1_17204 [Pistacia atlantica]|uniref:Uncharacterized protein n=1 Tax=Pistacia atlantica TaxID=434234 RepID=A0ACC1B7H8_9ROSI|nr:hypothetical protein Patl1_17204 [Pistacia atlantica]
MSLHSSLVLDFIHPPGEVDETCSSLTSKSKGFTIQLAASMAACLRSTPMVAFQICLQVWFTSSLRADGLAVVG